MQSAGYTSHIFEYIFNNHGIKFYGEPGTTTRITLDYKTTEYLGINKAVNEQLAAIDLPNVDYEKLNEYRKTQKPEDCKQAQLRNWETPGKRQTALCR